MGICAIETRGGRSYAPFVSYNKRVCRRYCECNKGQGAAVKTGLQFTKRDYTNQLEAQKISRLMEE